MFNFRLNNKDLHLKKLLNTKFIVRPIKMDETGLKEEAFW
jgi:hypothetical protein